jgi:phenylpyruvate tautomerase PptA (4-oxalocrotonate tautomerase family)
MPLIQLDTSISIQDQSRKIALAKLLSQATAEVTGKPEQYVMAAVQDNVAMTMGGADGPCALVAVKGIGGLSKPVNQALAVRICQLLQKELNIPANRTYLTFEEFAATHWAWDGKTFG